MIPIYALPRAADRVVAKRNATAVATALASKRLIYSGQVVGDPQFLYRVPYHPDDFWFTILLSDLNFGVRGQRRINPVLKQHFDVAFTHPSPGLCLTTPYPVISRELGRVVYGMPGVAEDKAARVLLTPRIRGLLDNIDFGVIHKFILNSFQIFVSAEYRDLDHCIAQTRFLRELLQTSFDLSSRESDIRSA
jgi:hypothetical protein